MVVPRCAILALPLALWAAATLDAQSPTLVETSSPAAPLNLALPTLGGQQFWTDELVYDGWRIQQNALTGHFRLLDSHDIRRAWGTRDECLAVFHDLKRREMLPPLDGKAVITVHGLIRSRDHMEGIGRFLADQGGFHWVNFSYASTRHSLDEHALSLAHVIEGLDGIDEIYFVCHSLGNLVVRRYLGEAQQPLPRWQPDGRIKRMVMLGPPNQGAEMAQRLKDSDLLALILGPSAEQLARRWDETQNLLATPPFPFAIVAGGRGDDRGFNPLVAGDDDGLVSVEETRLAGAADFRVVPCLHGRLMNDAVVRQLVLGFLTSGRFPSENEPVPAPAEAAKQPRE